MAPKEREIFHRTFTGLSTDSDSSDEVSRDGDKKVLPKRRQSHRTTAALMIVLGAVALWTNGQNILNSLPIPKDRVMRDTTSGPAVPPNAMAACLLLFDDNLSLVEWLAYNFHTMPLRHVIVLTDPRSKESPVPILERWSNVSLMTWELWDETHVFPSPESLQTLRDQGDLVKLHRARQSYFYAQCMRELKLRSKNDNQDEWVILTDVDEYVTINPRVSQKGHKLYQPHVNTTLTPPGSILSFLRQQPKSPPSCFHMARRDMVSKESSLDEISVGVPSFMNAQDYFSTRWRHQSHRKITGKCLVNLAKLHYNDLPIQTPKQGHIALTGFRCPQIRPKEFYTMETTTLVVNHYLGTKVQYQHRDDPRRDRTNEGFDQKQNQPTTVQDTARSWLEGFVSQVGQEQASRLLAGAGSTNVGQQHGTEQ